MKITVLIPTYKRKKYLNSLIKSLLLEKEYIKEIIILNTSKDSLNYKNKLINVLKNDNLLEGKNICLHKAKSDWVLILDDDLVLNKNTLSMFVKVIQKVKFSAASGVLIQKLKYKNYFLKKTIYGKQTFFRLPSLQYKKLFSKKPYKADFLPGGFMLLNKKDALKIGGFDTKYILPFYNEDTDLTVRLKKAGYNLYVLPFIKAKHIKAKRGGVRQKQSQNAWYYAFGFNNSYFYIKNYSLFIYFLYSVFNVRDHLSVIKLADFNLYLSYLKGIYEGYKNSQLFNS